MNLEGSRMLVTGGAGLIGSHVVDQLIAERPREIIAFDKDISRLKENRSPDLDYKHVTPLEGDISRKDEVQKVLKGVDYVVHTASLLSRESTKNLRAAFNVNIGGTFNLLEGSVEAGVKKVVYSSSISLYGHPVAKPMSEDHPLNTVAMYGAGKISSEFLLRVFKKMEGLEYVALRYAVVYGPRQHDRGNLVRYIPECFDRIDRGLPPIIYGDGSQPYDYVYVEDVARANVLTLKSPVTGESLNIGTGVTTTVADVVEMIREITGISLEPEYAPQGDWFGLESLYLDVTKAEKMLGFKAQVPLKEGLTRYYHWRNETMGLES